MNSFIKISVICPCYNSSNYIPRLINTLINQTYQINEIIFSDDGSTDNTVSLLIQYKNLFDQRNIKFIILENNHNGPGENRNLAIKASTNNWIAFLDSDDTWTHNKIEIIVKKIIENPTINVFLHWEKFIRFSGEVLDLCHGNKFDEYKDLKKQLYKGNFLSTSAVVCTREIILKADFFDKHLPNGQDYDLWLKMSPFMRLLIIKKFLGNYIEEKNSITLRPYFRRFLSEIIISYRHRKKVNLFEFIIKLSKILITRRWLT